MDTKEIIKQARANFHATYNGGYDGKEKVAYHHGMDIGFDFAEAFLLKKLEEQKAELIKKILSFEDNIKMAVDTDNGVMIVEGKVIHPYDVKQL